MTARFEIVHRESDTTKLTINDLGPWNRHQTVTNDAEGVVKYLVKLGHLWSGRALFYYDSSGALDEIIVRWPAGVFAGFRPGPGRGVRRMVESAVVTVTEVEE